MRRYSLIAAKYLKYYANIVPIFRPNDGNKLPPTLALQFGGTLPIAGDKASGAKTIISEQKTQANLLTAVNLEDTAIAGIPHENY